MQAGAGYVGWALLSLAGLTPFAAMAEAPRVITQAVNPAVTVTIPGNTRSEANAANDRGRVDDALALDHMQLLLQRPAQTESALVHFIDTLHNPSSPAFHHWLTAREFGETFGPAAEDVAEVTSWLRGQGFTVNSVHQSRMIIDFSGTAGQVRAAFGTEIHKLSVRGVPHLANMSDPKIPAALAPVVRGVVSLNDFRPHTQFKGRPAYTFNSGGSTYEAVTPGDLAKIYRFNPLFRNGITGAGQTIYLIEDTDVYSAADWTTFRQTFGLSQYTSGTFEQIHPASSGSNNCSDPGVVSSNEVEATLDAEWASAAAPDATTTIAACADTETTFGGLIALQNLVDSSTPPGIVSISYGECEPENGATQNAAYSAIYQQAVALGTSVFVSSGDEGAASCDADESTAEHGISVSGFASTPYNVAVGGTDFGDAYLGTTASFWRTRNTKTYESAISYIPEIPWNDSCASVLITAALGYSTPYGSGGSCNSAEGEEYFLTTASGSGGPSGCATGAAIIPGVVSGTCAGYAKPSWQKVVGNPADGVRDIPDVSLFAANGVFGHYYIFCDSDTSDGVTCSGAPSAWSGAGGTSFSSPILAGIQALVNQKKGGPQGEPNYVYYKLANKEYGASGSSMCNSTSAPNPVSCTFHDVTLGDMDVNCNGTFDCYTPSGSNGVLSTSSGAYDPAYGTNVGWDFATGIGTVDATTLVNKY